MFRQKHYTLAETIIHKLSARCLDGAIAVSPMVRDFARKIINISIEVVRPSIPEENYVKLGKVKPDLESKIIVSVGEARFSIGMDILVEHFITAKQYIHDLQLWIVGKGL